jgi:lysophospholipase L1-like esterase
MLDCIILGDSIAVGTQMFYKECQLVGKGGINTWQWNQMYAANQLTADTVVISLGTNDHKYVKTEQELRKMRNRVEAKRVFWILPANNLPASEVSILSIQNIVKQLASEYNDIVIEIKSLQPDKIHPSWAGYEQIVKEVKAK